jgi:hypothetical protein
VKENFCGSAPSGMTARMSEETISAETGCILSCLSCSPIRSIGGTPPESRSSVAWLSKATFNNFSICATSGDDLLIVLSVPGGFAEEIDW